MKHTKRAMAVGIFVAVLVLSILVSRQERAELRDGIQVHVIDVGQADCMVIETPRGNVMIDAGTDLSEGVLRAYLRSNGLTAFDCLILSHPHDDHIGGADMILREFSVKQVWASDNSSTEAVWSNVRNVLNEKVRTDEVEWIQPDVGTVCWVGEVRLEVLMAPARENQGENNDSLIVRAEYGDCSILLTGDAEAEAEKRLLASVPAEKLQATFLKVGHHGSSSSTTEDFLRAVDPKLASVSAGSGNSFSHPHEEVLDRLRKAGVAIYRTDLDGSLVFFCDGSMFSLHPPRS